MNERIQELAKGAKHAFEQEGILLELVLEKYAELIVRECALTLESITVPVFESVEDFDNGYNKALLTGSTVIKKHFGVKQ